MATAWSPGIQRERASASGGRANRSAPHPARTIGAGTGTGTPGMKTVLLSLPRAVLALAICAAASPGTQAADGRWEGLLHVPGAAAPVVLDLERRGAAWAGSAVLPGRGAPAARLRALTIDAAGVVRATLPLAQGGELQLELRPSADGRQLQGQGRQGGHRAALQLRRTGPPQVVHQPSGVPLAPALAGVWRGRYDIGFGPREVTLRITPPAATMTIVGRRTTEVSFDEVLQLGSLLRLRSSEFDITIEAPWADAAHDSLSAGWQQGPFEATLVLRREAAR
jgi:hypothetical protein